ncbi:sensor histidine kinase [Nonomuraea sp. KC401]|uniref:sensor histidine kinase n=1 Tax=unclassified Nonomuraea TaxID=2593643 RepID=UPI0010FED325|nr:MULTISPECIES: sensor histidine kinase [unclassified Nonomuraea]NBE95643.1 sensor histidine kinase [Nonomuraea sp. K271]TLF71875.1 sensor histidine kinase [Nonomuraea sp. KC401]
MAEPSPRREPAPVRHLVRITDITLAVLTLVFFVAVALATGVRGPWQGTIQLGLLLGALLLVRRRWPMTVLLLSVGGIFVYHLTGHWSPAGWIWPAAVAYFTAATTPRVRWVPAIGLAQLVYSAVDARWILDTNPTRYLVHVAGEGLLLAILIAAGLTYAAAMRWRKQLRETDHRAHAAEERLRVSHEVHDVIAHTLAVVGVQLNVAADALEEDPPAAAAALRLAKDVRNRAMTDLRTLITTLRDNPSDTAPQADLASLDTLIADARTAGLEVTLDEHGDRAAVPAITAIAIYRVVQESLANTLKHAGASKVEVTIGYQPRSITVEITDNGRGVPGGGEVTEGHGLAGMRERVSALGGALTAGPVPDGGFAVRADIPVAGSTA